MGDAMLLLSTEVFVSFEIETDFEGSIEAFAAVVDESALVHGPVSPFVPFRIVG
jgi:hypothetical protein